MIKIIKKIYISNILNLNQMFTKLFTQEVWSTHKKKALMASKCIDNGVKNETDVLSVEKVTSYTNLHKWPMAEVEFVQSIRHGNSQHHTMVLNNISCRQMYLRSYTFTRKENEGEGGRGGGKTGDQWNRGEKKKSAETTKKGMRKKSKATPCRGFVLRLLWKCFSCTSSTKVNIDSSLNFKHFALIWIIHLLKSVP